MRFTIPDDPTVHVRIVPPETAAALRRLADRGEAGVHLSVLGGIDSLGELAALGIPFEARAYEERGTGSNRCWIVALAPLVIADA